jgi:hypothetical protein
MSLPGRPKGAFRSAPHEGTPVNTPQATADTAQAAAAVGLRSSWLQRLPPGLFGIPLGVPGIGTGPMLAVLSRWSWWREAPFSPGFWSLSLPLAAYAGVTVEAVHRGGWPAAPAWVAVTVASAVVGYLALRTLALWRGGRLLPPT